MFDLYDHAEFDDEIGWVDVERVETVEEKSTEVSIGSTFLGLSVLVAMLTIRSLRVLSVARHLRSSPSLYSS